MDSSRSIQSQVRLPFSVAFEVVMQGIRIRMGRSVVTMMGVVLGVAFLMSILSANVIRRGMAEETALRQEVQRMVNFLEAETGPVRGRVISLAVLGPLSEVETRLVNRIQRSRPLEVRFFVAPEVDFLPPDPGVLAQDESSLGEGSSGMVVMGDGALPPWEWEAMAAEMRQPVFARTRQALATAPVGGFIDVALERSLRPEEVERQERMQRQERARSIWIISIALMVTIIGITNSLLMSVTERFREIGTMKCLGALSSFIRRVFFIESALTGLVGSLIGGIVGFVIATLIYAFTFGFGLVFVSIHYGDMFMFYVLSVLGGVGMAILAAIYPASFASRMVPATALRSNI